METHQEHFLRLSRPVILSWRQRAQQDERQNEPMVNAHNLYQVGSGTDIKYIFPLAVQGDSCLKLTELFPAEFSFFLRLS